MDDPVALRPLVEAADDIRRLDDYDTSRELAAAILAVAEALDASLRARLRGDAQAPEEHRLRALSREQLPSDEVVKSLRTRDLISLETAGTLHQAQAATERAAAGEPRPADADLMRAAVDRVREDFGPSSHDETARETEADAGPAEPAEPAEPAAAESALGSRWMRWIAAAFAAAFVIGAAWVVTRGGSAEYEDAMAAFRAGRHDSAAAGFEAALEEWPQNVTVMLYLARSYRRVEQPSDAAEVLQRALEVDPEDAAVRRELGHLFMDLGRPASAVAQYERALEYAPEDPLNWAALIRGLRQMGDPRAEQLLRDAPPEVRAVL